MASFPDATWISQEMTKVCTAVHSANENGLHRNGFCEACASLYVDLNILVTMHDNSKEAIHLLKDDDGN